MAVFAHVSVFLSVFKHFSKTAKNFKISNFQGNSPCILVVHKGAKFTTLLFLSFTFIDLVVGWIV